MSECGYTLRGLSRFIRAGLAGNWRECRRIAGEMTRLAGRDSVQKQWDAQIKANLAAPHFGRGRESRMIAARMMHCPNNPRNGGDGFDMGDGTWRDWRWKP